MRKWWKKLGIAAGCLAGFEALNVTADAQGPGFGGGMAPPMSVGSSSMSMPGQQQKCSDPSAATCLPNDGSPNSFSEWENCNPWSRPVFWVGAEAVYGITKQSPLAVPLLTSSSNPNVNTDVGAIGQPATTIPGNQSGFDLRHPFGVIGTVGFSPTPEWKIPFEANVLYLRDTTTAIAAQSDIFGNPLLARPIISTAPGQEGEKVYLSSFPGLAIGGQTVEASMQLIGIDGRAVIQTGLQWGDDGNGVAIDLPVGVRYLELSEVATISSNVTATSNLFALPFLGNNFGQGDRTIVTDSFKTTNTFLGGEFGVRLESRWNRFSLTVEPRVSVGAIRQAVFIDGNSVLQQPGQAPVTTPSGLLAVASNSGIHSREQFSYLPEGTLHVGWDVFSWMRIQVGYNIVYWQNVVRPGDQISRAVDVRQVPTDLGFTGINGNSPIFQFKESNFLLQAASIGIVFAF